MWGGWVICLFSWCEIACVRICHTSEESGVAKGGGREGEGRGGMYGGMGNLGEGLLEGRDGGRGSLRHEKGKTRPVLVAGDVGCKGRLGLVLFQKQMITI